MGPPPNDQKREERSVEPFHEQMEEYQQQLRKGVIQKAYRGLMDYLMGLKAHFKDQYPEYAVSGGIYYGYMDMTYFALFPESLKGRGLKIAVVFLHEANRFEVWLAGSNKQVQARYWKLFQEGDWHKYTRVSTTEGADSILEHILADKPDFGDLDALTARIEKGTVRFIEDVQSLLSEH